MPLTKKIIKDPPAMLRYTIADTTDFIDFGASLYAKETFDTHKKTSDNAASKYWGTNLMKEKLI
jgi:hypothetical protein